MEIFSKEAPAYWAKGISVLPLYPKQKRPIINVWSHFCVDLPTQTTREAWLNLYPNSNIGVALGPQSKLVFIDIDTTDPKLTQVIEEVLPPSPWKRVGAKGCIYAYRYNGEASRRISNSQDRMIIEILSQGTQAVLPPSIHPDTNQPYTSNVPLLEVYDQLPKLPDHFEQKLRAALSTVTDLRSSGNSRFKLLEFVSAGSRDVKMTQHAGLMARGVTLGEHTLKEALDLMQAWADNKVEQLSGDQLDVKKGLSKIIEFIRKDVDRGKILPPNWDEGLTPEQKIEWNLTFTEIQEEWTLAQINDHILAKWQEYESPSDPRRAEVVHFILRKLASSQHLNELEKGRIIKTLRDTSGLDVPLSFYNKELKNLSKGSIEGVSHEEIAQATIQYFEEREGKLIYNKEQLWRWSGAYWVPVEDNMIWRIIAQEFGNLIAAKKATDHKGIIQVIKQLVPQGVEDVTWG